MAVSRMDKIEIVTRVERRRRFTDEEKLRLVAESRVLGSSVAKVAKRHGLSPSLIFGWRRAILHGHLESPDETGVSLAEGASGPFLRIQASMTPDRTEAMTVRITFPNGVLLDVPAALDPQRIAALMRSIHQAC